MQMERLTIKAQEALQGAQTIAQRFSHQQIDGEHLMLALLDQSVAELETAHVDGLSAAEIPVLRTLFDSQLRMLVQLEAARKRTPVAEVLP